ncbi:hypothetical protein OBBRIDRAFT_831652 [Obba rivulosa]|uniref:Uncharacterized protein n=1 Tax=Obba rivulosa TaxID=1052685 RepID=A0A8E2DRS3_9APHY|nr:hypothetical protein OBBRIDRAFT_831652 [Obba rivulosa]
MSGQSDLPGLHPELQALQQQLRAILADMRSFAPSIPKPPILDTSIRLVSTSHTPSEPQSEGMPGLRALRDAVQRDLSVLNEFLADPHCSALPPLSTNAPYLVAVWNEVQCAPPPVTAIWQTFPDPAHAQGKATRKRGSQKPPGVKVDVIAEGGRRWIRVNTIKNSRLLAEFREVDSYLTSSEEESSDEAEPSSSGSTPRSPSWRSRRPPPLDNSLLRGARALLDATSSHLPLGSRRLPHVTLRLTRLDPTCGDDARIPQTVDALRGMGIDVQLGERAPGVVSAPSSSPNETQEHVDPVPTQKINLDLSLLVALVSDITHAPLPSDEGEAKERYIPPKGGAYWKWKMGARAEEKDGAGEDSDGERDDNSQDEGWWEHSRALGQQTMQDMRRGLLQDMHERLAELYSPVPSSPPNSTSSNAQRPDVEFYTTSAARTRFLQIVLSKIGGPAEQRRARALFCLPEDYSPEPLLSSSTIAHTLDLAGDRTMPTNGTSTSDTLPTVDVAAAEEAYWRDSRYPPGLLPLIPIRVLSSVEPATPSSLPANLAALSMSDTPSPAPAPFFRQLAHVCRTILATHDARDGGPQPPRLTHHTAESLLAGAARGWTTMTANRASVRAVLRGLRAQAEAGCCEDAGVERPRRPGEGEPAGRMDAALWVVDPRSLAEGMRGDSLDREGG